MAEIVAAMALTHSPGLTGWFPSRDISSTRARGSASPSPISATCSSTTASPCPCTT
jgi:hypothetical protein